MIRTFLHWLSQFCSWIDQTAFSQTIQTTPWIVPTVQTIHILAVAVVVGSALMIDLRLLGILWRDQPLGRVSKRFLPCVWWPLIILLATGAVMIAGEPARSLLSPIFQLKMGLLISAIIVTGIQYWLLRTSPGWGAGAALPGVAWLLAIPSLLLWTGIIFAGRWIAYW
jgi:hypothetical protein